MTDTTMMKGEVMKLVVGIVLDSSKNPRGYMVYDTKTGVREQQNTILSDVVYNPNIRDKYIMYSLKGRITRNKDAKVTYVNGDQAWCYTHKGGWQEFTGRLTDKEVAIVNPSTLIFTDEKDSVIREMASTSDDFSNITYTGVQGREVSPSIGQSHSRVCKEYQVCKELKLSGVRTLADLNYYTFGRMVDTLYFAELPLQWAKERFGSQLKALEKITIRDGYKIVECKSTQKFKTQSVIVQGSKFNEIYLLVNRQDELVRAVTSYSMIEDILDILLSLDDYEDNPEYKELRTVASHIHLKNPRADIEWAGAAINRKDGGMYLSARVRELGKVYWIKLLAIANYAEFVEWSDSFDTDEEGAYFEDMLHGIEGIIRNTAIPNNKLSQILREPRKMIDSQYRFAL